MDAKEEIKEKLSVEEIVGEYVELKRAGRNYKAISPFTNEKTASFMVSPDKQIWHDFSSGKGGDIFSFVMEMEGVDFRGSLEILARKAGIELKDFQGDGQSKLKNRLFEANQLATNYYHATLAKNKTALEYLIKNRQYSKETITLFKMGFAPSNGKALSAFLTKKGFSPDEIKKAGLATKSRDLYDLFRGRVLIPLNDGQGRPVGFTGRKLSDEQDGPKYLNTPSTLVYDKGRQLFGLHLAKDAIRKADYTVIVEGNLDVVASHQAGVKNVVASAGTALTRQQLLSLNRLSEDVRLAFDADSAGLNATERAIPIAQEVGVRLSIIEIPTGKDPDDIIREDPKKWIELTKKSVYVVDWIMKTYQKNLDISTSQGKKAFSDKSLAVIARLLDPVEREHYVKEVASKLNVSVNSIQNKLDNLDKDKQHRKKSKAKIVTKEEISRLNQYAYQDQLLGLNLLYPDCRISLRGLEAVNFEGEERKQIAQFIIDSDNKSYRNVPPELQEIGDYVKIILFKTEELYEDWNSTDRTIEAVGLTGRLKRDTIQKRKHLISESIKRAEAIGNDSQVQELLEEFNKILKE